MDSLLEKEVLEDVEKYAGELNVYSEYTVSPEKKKRVEQHHKYKVRHTKDLPGSDFKNAKFQSNHPIFLTEKYAQKRSQIKRLILEDSLPDFSKL